jgi:hypothetical protein
MAASTTIGWPIKASASVTLTFQDRVNRRRALKILGHAIEYLTDEDMHEGEAHCSINERIQAVLLLMDLNRQVYSQCPEVPTLAQRCLSIIMRLKNVASPQGAKPCAAPPVCAQK